MMDFVSWDDDYSQLNGKIKIMFQTTTTKNDMADCGPCQKEPE
jgi:hypothetical protein